MAKATMKTYEALAELYLYRDMEVELSDDPLLESLSISFDEFKDYVRANNIRHKRHIAKCEMILRKQRGKR